MAIFEKVDDTTYRTPDIGDVHARAIIGGNDPAKFVPNINFSYQFESGGERFWWNLNAKDVTTTGLESVNYSGTTKDVDIRVGDITEKYLLADEEEKGQSELIKWVRTFHVHPGTNEWEHQLTYPAGVQFDYQPALEQWQIDGGHIRPKWVVGSYVVRCNQKGVILNEKKVQQVAYKTGKMGMILPPLFEDADGKTRQASIHIDQATGIYTITIDPVWFAAARFPVVANDTFGNTSVQSTTITIINQVAGWFESGGSAGTMQSIHTYLTGGPDEINMGYYNGPENSVTTHVAHGTEERGTWSGAWESVDVTGSISASTGYWLMCQAEHEENEISAYYDNAGGEDLMYDGTETYDTWGDNPSMTHGNNYIMSVYATYTTGGADIIELARHHYAQMRD